MILMEIWRRKCVVPMKEPHGVAQHGIGSHVDLAVISADGVKIERIHTGPDEIGKPITP